MIKSRNIIGKPMVTITHGEMIGKVKDVLIDPEKLEVAALVLPGKLLRRRKQIVPHSEVVVFGTDVILVKSNKALPPDEPLEGVSSLIAFTKQIKGQQIITEQGLRVGLVGDVLIDESGKIVGYDLAKVFVEGPLAESRYLPLEVARTVGPDMIIVDANALEIDLEDF